MTPLLTAGIEKGLNTFLWRDRSLKTARQRLLGKVLRVELASFSTPLVLVFSEPQIDVLSQWEGKVDCRVMTGLSTLSRLRDKQQLTALIRSGELDVEGDIQVVQSLMSLIDLAELDPAELLAPYIGDIAAESLSQIMYKAGSLLKTGLKRNQQYFAEAVTEEWRIAPGALEVAWFTDETDAIAREVESLSVRLARLEGK